MNLTILKGRLGNDPEFREINSGAKVANFNLATTEFREDFESKEIKKSIKWHKVEVWNNLGEMCHHTLNKGDEVIVIGQSYVDSWKDENDVPKYTQRLKAKFVLPGNMLI